MRNIKSLLQQGLLYACRLFPIKKNKVLFQSYYGDAYNDNPFFISQNLLNNVDIVWAVTRKIDDIPSNVRQVCNSSVKYIYELATSKVWVDNCRKREWVRKRKGQYYIQTWHGNLGNKKTEGAAIDTLEPEYILRAQNDAKMTDLMISGSSFFTNLIRKYFWYDGEICECGTPRLDSFFSQSNTTNETIRRKLNIPTGVRIALYAPTFRADKRLDCYALDYTRIINALENKTGEKWVFLVRFHPNVAFASESIAAHLDNVIDVTNYPDLYELIPISDIIISDYSSLTFEAGLLLKPVFLFALDLSRYEQERGFYIDIHEQPYILAQSNEGLINRISDFDVKAYEEALNQFNLSLGINEKGNAAEIIAQRIMGILNE